MSNINNPTKAMVPGINLLDWFAGQALASIATDFSFPAEAARKAYAMAEAMVAEKNRRAKA
jgi:hypothetical protein